VEAFLGVFALLVVWCKCVFVCFWVGEGFGELWWWGGVWVLRFEFLCERWSVVLGEGFCVRMRGEVVVGCA